jgi:hypothetical protein
MNSLRHRLMLEEALQRLSDADLLAQKLPLGESTDSPYLLRLLSFELLLKLVFERTLQQRAPSRHEYHLIFGRLTANVRQDVLARALAHAGPSKLSPGHDAVLEELGKNFIALRYPYDRYDGMSEEQYATLGAEWVARGAPDTEAWFRYHPAELRGLIHALSQLAQEP